MAVKLVIDHVRGARRGQRQIIEDLGRVTFGRHPSSVVAFDATTDIDASSQHAELVSEFFESARANADETCRYLLRDVGSSNGTWIDGQSVETRVLGTEAAVEVEFGNGGPIVRLWLGASSPPAPISMRRRWRKLLPW